MGGTFLIHKFKPKDLNGMRSRMNREVHIRNCESLRGKFPWATRPCGVLWSRPPPATRLYFILLNSTFRLSINRCCFAIIIAQVGLMLFHAAKFVGFEMLENQ